MAYNRFYYNVPKDAADMTDDELLDEHRACAATAALAAIYGEGISTKEGVRARRIDEELAKRRIVVC